MIVASMATLPGRREMARLAVASILPQVDVLHIWLDKHDADEAERAEDVFCGVASMLGIPWHRIGFAHGDRGDGGKFAALAMLPDDATWLVCDDDIEYPSDYADTMRTALHRAEGAYASRGGLVRAACVVGLHALRLPERCTSYRRQRVHEQHCLRYDTRPEDMTRVHVLGTSSVVTRPRYLRGFETVDVTSPPNVGDLHLAAWCERQGVPRYCLPLPREGWLGNLLPGDAPSIWDGELSGGRAEQMASEDAVVSSVEWGAL